MENNELTDHAYDGIQEYDNPLPGWWKWMFIGTFVFSLAYLMYFHIGARGRSLIETYDTALAENTRLQFGEIGDLQPTANNIMMYNPVLSDSKKSWLKVGQTVFKTNCVSCHGRNGEGKVGPNLTDDVYKNVRKVEDIAMVINKGAGNGAMPAWADRLHPNEVVFVSAYVAMLRDTNVEGGKAPDGGVIDPWPEPPAETPEAEAKSDS